MIKRFFFSIVFVLTAIMSFANEIDTAYRIDSLHYDAHVGKDNVWKVTETLYVTFDEERHGIYRHIPRRFIRHQSTNGAEEKYTYLSEVKDVAVEGYEFQTSDADNNEKSLTIRIGSKDKTIKGSAVYKISYTLAYPDDRYTFADELNHNLLGADVNTTIAAFTYNIEFEKELPQNIAINTYSGEYGSKNNALSVTPHIYGNVIKGDVAHIAPFNGITISAQLPEGYWEDAASVNTLWAWIALVVMTVLFVITMVQLILHRREHPIVSFEYEAPEGISSAEAGVIIDNTADLKDLTSLIVWFASKGYLKIREIEGKKHTFKKDEYDMELTKLKDLPDDAPKYQKLFFNVFFKEQDSVVLSELTDRHEQITKAQLALSRYFKGKRKLSGTHWLSLITAIAFLICGIATFGMSSCVESCDVSMLAYGILLWAFPVFVVALLRIAFSNYDMMTTMTKRLIQYIAILLIGVVGMGIFWIFFFNAPDMTFPLEVCLGMVASGWIVALFSARMLRDTKYRKEMMSRLLGFREFIDKSEMPMLKAQVDENPSYFFDVLPYAMIFGLTKKWQKKFKDIDVQNPDWYEPTNTNLGMMSGLLIADHLNSNLSRSMHTIAAPVSSHDPGSISSGSGMSFSGGGGGGGGVGSW